MLLRYFLNYFEMVSVARIINGISIVFTFHIGYISIVRFLYFTILSTSFLITFQSPEISVSINRHVLFFIIMDTLSSSAASSPLSTFLTSQ